jgi:hypothetical protein
VRAALLALAASSAARGAAVIAAGDTTYGTPLGRTTTNPASRALALSWLGGGLEVSHTGTTLRATFAPAPRNVRVGLYAGAEHGEVPWEGVALVPASGANETVVIGQYAGLVRALSNVPADYFGDTFEVLALETDGEFVPRAPPAARRRVLHVLGDSITAATNVRGGFEAGCADEGASRALPRAPARRAGSRHARHHNPNATRPTPSIAATGSYADYSSSWAGVLCAFFGASCSTVAVGGIGLVRNCCGQPTTLPGFYTQTSKGSPRGSFAFDDAVPDGVIVYLGTNDYSAGGSAALDASFTAAWLELMENVTTRYYGTPSLPANITFLAVLGPMSPTLPAAATLAAVAQGTARGFRIVLVNATEACGDASRGACVDGCAGHPGVASHRNIARLVAPAVEAALGWPAEGVI